MITFPYVVPALRVSQNLGTYFVAVLPAKVLLETCYSDRLRAIPNNNGEGYKLDGTQRGLNHDRLTSISQYLTRRDSAFPNSIILAANFREEDGTGEDEEANRWLVSQGESGQYSLTIPTSQKLAAVIDGQHRLFAFAEADSPDNSLLDTDLICSVFLDLPKPFQAQLFATINSTQQPVPKSLTYELFGYNIEKEDSDHWSPDKLAVFLSRKLNTDADSPLQNRIIIAPENDFLIGEARPCQADQWKISMATAVEGILRLISSNPKRDTSELLTPKPKPRCTLRLSKRHDKSPLRDLYLSCNDQLIYLIVSNYLTAVNNLLWANSKRGSFIVKTIGLQASFDILRKLCSAALTGKDVSVGYFESRLANLRDVDFDHVAFRNASGAGRANIRKFIEVQIGILGIESIAPNDNLYNLIVAAKRG